VVDLEKFFDRVTHDRLMATIAERVSHKRMLKLIRAFLPAGVMEGGLVGPMDEGTPLRSSAARGRLQCIRSQPAGR
jgi:RNA-directed DNA polymerase